MKTRSILAAAAVAAALLGLPASPASAAVCSGATGADTSGTAVPTPAGNVYAGSNAEGDGGHITEQSDRGYIQVDGDLRNGGHLHGSTNDGAVSGSLAFNSSGVTDLCVNGTEVI